jgi:S1-C subfamily serine protease
MPSRLLARVVGGCALVIGFLWLTAGVPSRADNPSLDVAVLKAVKAATVHLEVVLPDGTTAEGSGFFTDEPGVLVTNAHVLGMLDADSRPPQKVAVTINSGEASARTMPARLLGLDRGSDLAVLRVEPKGLPQPLKVVPAKDLVETQEVFIFGFPFGKRLGKNITVSKSSVSSLRKENGVLKQVQVNGGMHPGNSGGPVINAKGQVVGMSVSGYSGTQVQFAIPGELVSRFLGGRVSSLSADLGYKDGERVKMPFRLATVDPLGRIKKVSVETWVGDPGTRRRPGGSVQPKPLPGDSERQLVAVKYDKQPITSVELVLPRPDPKKVYWIQPSYTNGSGETVWYPAWAPNLGQPVERKEIAVRYQPRVERTELTEVVSQGSFQIRVEGEEHSLAMNSKATLNERLAAKKGAVVPIHVDYKGFTLTVLEDKKVVKGDDELKKHMNNIRFLAADLDMEADGAVGKTKGDLSKVPRESRAFVETLNDQVLQSLELVAVPLPSGNVRPLQNWRTQRMVLLGSTLLGVPGTADIKYTYLGTRMLNNREIAMLNVAGTVKGLRGAGLNVGGTVDGASQVALDTGEVLSATMNFKADMDLEYKGRKAKLFGTLTVRIQRDMPPVVPKKDVPKN